MNIRLNETWEESIGFSQEWTESELCSRNDESLCWNCWASVLMITRGWRRSLFYLPVSCILAWKPYRLWLSFVAGKYAHPLPLYKMIKNMKTEHPFVFGNFKSKSLKANLKIRLLSKTFPLWNKLLYIYILHLFCWEISEGKNG